MKITQNRKWVVRPLIVGLTTLSAMGALQAQPDEEVMPKGDNPPADQRGGRGGNRPRMTPEQREQMRKQAELRRETEIRKTLTEAGFTDKAIQDAVVTFANDQADGPRVDTRENIRKLNQALRNNATDEQITLLLNDIRTDIETAKALRENALKELDKKIGYTQKPRLEAVLLLAGITGENPGGGGFGGRGGGGGRGGQGGGFGGRGGQGGGPGGPGGPGGGQADND